MSEEESQLRTTLVTSLLEAASANAARGAEAIRLFEIGRVYLPAGDGLSNEPMRIGAILSGPSRQVGWRDQQPPDSDVHSALAVVGTLMSRLRCDWVAAPAQQSLRFLIPGSAATLLIDGQDVGFAGELHPSVAAEFGLQTASLFELEFSALAVGSVRVPRYRSISPHPAVNQDLAVIVAEGVSSGSLVATATTAGGDLFESVSIFDVYSGDQVGEGMVSIGLRLTFRAPDRTLTEEEASLARAAILVALENEHGASGRG
jgi:phenylalanyl-tRNA synthetase beta chain